MYIYVYILYVTIQQFKFLFNNIPMFIEIVSFDGISCEFSKPNLGQC